MALMRCKSCGGEYDPLPTDGVPYFHACPPITTVHVERAGNPIDVPLADVRATDLLFVERAGAIVRVLPAAFVETDRRSGDQQIQRADKRDENVKVTGYDKTGNPIVAPKSEGKGTEPAPPK